jgi:hypothetical protein
MNVAWQEMRRTVSRGSVAGGATPELMSHFLSVVDARFCHLLLCIYQMSCLFFFFWYVNKVKFSQALVAHALILAT